MDEIDKPLTQEEVDSILWNALRQLTVEEGQKLRQIYKESYEAHPLILPK